ncbi:MAG: DUF3320 domain-containing protein [Phycisphaerales bacterium]|nr:DUF3320 domain-containing protein [Phycisphaerales bacterium]
MQQYGVPLVQRVSVTNHGDAPLTAVEVRISLSNDEVPPWMGRIERLDVGTTYHIEPKEIGLNAQRQAARTETEKCDIRVTVAVNGAEVNKSFPVEMLAYDQWPGTVVYPELIAAFVTPNMPQVATLLGEARASLRSLRGSDAFDGYQSASRKVAAQIAEACFNAALARRLGYINPPASFDRDGQRVRLIDRLLREGFGSCLDLSLLLGSLWEQAGLHPLVLLIEGHAMAAVWTRQAALPEPAIEEAAQLRNLIELGEIIPVEATLLTTQGVSFAAAVASASKRLESPGASFCAIDIAACRKRGVHPLPLRADGESLRVELGSAAGPIRATIPGAGLERVALADRSDARTGGSSAAPAGRVKAWQTRLLDLTLRNRLINFRQTLKTVRFNVPDLAKLEDLLAEGGRIRLHPKTDGDDAYLRQQLDEGHVFASESPADLQRRLLELYRAARVSIEETGANVLHLAIGMLKWYENPVSTDPRVAPLVLLPVTLTRLAAGAGYRYELSLSEEPIKANVTLLEKLRTQFGIKTDGLDQFVEDENGIDVDLALRAFREAIRDMARWEVEESAQLGLFSFNKFLMWRDLQDNLERLKENRLVKHLLDPNASAFDRAPFPRADDLDDAVPPAAMFCTRDADSSQMAAIRAASDDRTFVLEGPPGTGKSQTIANLIADSLARGKRVLFVAEKMAALSVVRRRLEEDGLGPFCLELHSAKASKKEVLEQLKSGMDAAATGDSAGWERSAAEIASSRLHLNTYVREMHKVRDSGETLYQVLGRKIALGDGARAAPAAPDITKTSASALSAWRAAVAALVEHAAPVHPPHLHALRDVTRSEWNFALPEQTREALGRASQALGAFGERVAAFGKACGLIDCSPTTVSRAEARGLSSIAAILSQAPGVDVGLLEGRDSAALASELRGLVRTGKHRDAERARLLGVYGDELLQADHAALISRVASALRWPAPLGVVASFIVRRGFRRFCKDRVPTLEVLRADLEAARQLKLDSEKLRNASGARLLGRRWKEGCPDWQEVESTLHWCDEFRKAAGPLQESVSGAAWVSSIAQLAVQGHSSAAVVTTSKELVKAWNGLMEAIRRIKDLLAPNEAEAFGASTLPGWLSRMSETLTRWGVAVPSLNDWCSWRRTRDAASTGGLAELVSLYESGRLERTELAPAFERGYADRWFTTVANGVEAVRGFNSGRHEALQERFRQLDRGFVTTTRREVAAKLSARAPAHAPDASPQSELGLLQREIQKRRAHLPTRRLIESIPNLVARLKPCFLMSPLSVAQYLDAKLPPFDVVVFDEASQIPVWDAIGAVARGTEVIVVGDSKQLPPTSFFDTIGGDDEPQDTAIPQVEELESILSECNAAGIPKMDLKWHYRSRHESLIAFSNHHYYSNKLHTFPSPIDRGDEFGVTFRHVANGMYDRGASRTNRVEAEVVVEEVVRLLTATANPDSIGIVTFNQAQQLLIEDLLDVKRRERPEIDRFFTTELTEPVFVKNLENVQGDERDTIIFSVGYGPDQAGRPSMNFGPLNQDGGERRLNVAITRAKKRLIVFSSLKSDQIDLRRTRATGVAHFKTFLDYAERGPRAIAEAIEHKGTTDFESGFEHAVWKALTDKGWSVDTQVGCAGYRVDLAVRDPDAPGRYVLGIECDGAAYHSGKTARDRDRLRQAVLEGLGWRIVRVWSTDWFVNSERCMKSLEKAIQEAQRVTHTSVPVPVPGSVGSPSADPRASSASLRNEGLFSAAPQAMTRGTAPRRSRTIPAPPKYKRRAVSMVDLIHGDPCDPSTTHAAIEALVRIVDDEGPIVEELAMRRLAERFGGQRMTDRFRERFGAIASSAVALNRVKQDGDTFWPRVLSPDTYVGFRVPGVDEDEQRDLKLVPAVERANAAVHVLRVQFSLPRDELEKETARLLGLQRIHPRARDLVSEGIELAISKGRIIEREGRLIASEAPAT